MILSLRPSERAFESDYCQQGVKVVKAMVFYEICSRVYRSSRCNEPGGQTREIAVDVIRKTRLAKVARLILPGQGQNRMRSAENLG